MDYKACYSMFNEYFNFKMFITKDLGLLTKMPFRLLVSSLILNYLRLNFLIFEYFHPYISVHLLYLNLSLFCIRIFLTS